MNLLQSYSWPGNVRELSNVVARALALRSSNLIGPESLPEHVVHCTEKDFPAKHLTTKTNIDEILREWSQSLLKVILYKGSIDFMELEKKLEQEAVWVFRQVIGETLVKTGNNRTEAAKVLNISPRVLRYYLNEKGRE